MRSGRPHWELAAVAAGASTSLQLFGFGVLNNDRFKTRFVDAAPPTGVHLTSRKIDFERTIRRTKKPPAQAGGFFELANKVLIALP